MEFEYIQILLEDLPTRIRAFSRLNADSGYTIVINARMSYEQQLKSYEHELQHIKGNDFYKDIDAGTIEYLRHNGKEIYG